MTSRIQIVEDEPLLRRDAAEHLIIPASPSDEASNADEAIALVELHNDIRPGTAQAAQRSLATAANPFPSCGDDFQEGRGSIYLRNCRDVSRQARAYARE
jgi:hypothetical protein